MAPAARAAGEGRGVFSSVCSTAALMSSCVSARAPGRRARVIVAISSRLSRPIAAHSRRGSVKEILRRRSRQDTGLDVLSGAADSASRCAAGTVGATAWADVERLYNADFRIG